MIPEYRIHGYGIQAITLEYPSVVGCGLYYAYYIEQGIYINCAGLMVLCEDEDMIRKFNVTVVCETEGYTRHNPIPLAQRTDANENSTDIPEERKEPVRQ